MLSPALVPPLGVSTGVCRQVAALYINGHLASLQRLLTAPKNVRQLACASDPTPQSIYLTSVNGNAHSSPILLGLVNYLERHLPHVGFFKPVAGATTPLSPVDKHVDLIYKAMNWKGSPENAVALNEEQATRLVAAGKMTELQDRVYSAFQSYRNSKGLVVIEGTPIGGLELDAQLASSLGAPALIVMGGNSHLSAQDYFSKVMLKRQVLLDHRVDVLGVVLNKVPPQDQAIVQSQLRRKLDDVGIPLIGAMPQDPLLASVRMDDIVANLGANVVFGSEALLDVEFTDVIIGAQRVEELFETLEASSHTGSSTNTTGGRPLIVTTQDRLDIVLGLLAAQVSVSGPAVAGVLLTQAGWDRMGRSYGREAATRIFKGIENSGYSGALMPVLTVNKPMFEVVQQLNSIVPSLQPTSSRKIMQAKHLFDRYVDINPVVNRLEAMGAKPARMTPKMFTYNLRSKCKASPQRIVLPEANDNRVLRAAAEVVHRGLANVILLGDPEVVQAEAAKLGLDISGCSIHNPKNSELFQKYVDILVELRKSKGLTRETAADLLLGDPNFWGTMMVQQGDADGMVSGAIHTTASTIRPALQVLRSGGGSLVSSVFFMCLPDKVLVYGDCAVNVQPTAQDLAKIAITSADTAAAFGIEPRVAMLSYSTLGSGAGPDVQKVEEATKMVKEQRPDLLVEGPIQYDAAIDPAVAKVKVKGKSEVAGQASVFIFPDLNTGNNTYKAVQQSTGAVAMGPVMQGLMKPVNDLSRGCTVQDIVDTVCVTSIQAMQAKGV